jgi:hypothetical protein
VTSISIYRRLAYPAVSFAILTWVLLLWVLRLRARWDYLSFDDAYMFLRYATNFRHGLGVSWNLDGVPTYGMTAPLWGFVVLLASYLPLRAQDQLILSSWLCSLGAMVAMARAVAMNARSDWMSSTWRVLPMVALPLAYQFRFTAQAFTGMETMLAILLGSVYVGSALSWERGNTPPAWVGLVGFLFCLTRPEAALAVVLMPLMLLWLMPNATLRGTAVLLGTFLVCLTAYLLVCRVYFHSALPLSFYEKSLRGYKGYVGQWYPRLSLLLFLTGAPVYLAVAVLLVRRQDWRRLCCCLVPALITCFYLTTTLQIMGMSSRYYEAYLGFFVVPVLLLVDSRSIEGEPRWASSRRSRFAIAGLLLAFSTLLRWHGVTPWLRRMDVPVYAYEQVSLRKPAKLSLPASADPWGFELEIARRLPLGSTVAHSEVGYLGVAAPQVNVIDLVGLNDTDIALHDFRMDALLARKPDVIFFPSPDYTYQCGVMLADPKLYELYDVYYESGGPRLALRRASASYSQAAAQLNAYWSKNYPGYAMQDYRVRSASWSQRQNRTQVADPDRFRTLRMKLPIRHVDSVLPNDQTQFTKG